MSRVYICTAITNTKIATTSTASPTLYPFTVYNKLATRAGIIPFYWKWNNTRRGTPRKESGIAALDGSRELPRQASRTQEDQTNTSGKLRKDGREKNKEKEKKERRKEKRRLTVTESFRSETQTFRRLYEFQLKCTIRQEPCGRSYVFPFFFLSFLLTQFVF